MINFIFNVLIWVGDTRQRQGCATPKLCVRKRPVFNEIVGIYWTKPASRRYIPVSLYYRIPCFYYPASWKQDVASPPPCAGIRCQSTQGQVSAEITKHVTIYEHFFRTKIKPVCISNLLVCFVAHTFVFQYHANKTR